MKIKVDKDLNVKIVNDKWKYATIIIAFIGLITSIIYLIEQDEQIKVIYKQWVSAPPEGDLPIKEEAWILSACSRRR